jgi:glycosyltransferase involved in cell wall biosynthesis
MNTASIVSVLMPVYNMADVVSKSINSILNQTYSNFEFLILDDGSTDNTWDILSTHKDCRISLHRFEIKKGRPEARNFLLKKATGEYVVWIDSDDFALPQLIETKLKQFKIHPQVIGIGNSAIIKLDENYYTKTLVSNTSLLKAQILFKSPFVFSSFMHKNIRNIYFDTNLNRSEDMNFIFDLFKHGQVINISDNLLLVNYGLSENHHQIFIDSLPYIKLYTQKVLPTDAQFPMDNFIVLLREPKTMTHQNIHESIFAFKQILPNLKLTYPAIYNEIKAIYTYQVLKCSWVVSPVFLKYLRWANPFHVFQLYLTKY